MQKYLLNNVFPHSCIVGSCRIIQNSVGYFLPTLAILMNKFQQSLINMLHTTVMGRITRGEQNAHVQRYFELK